MDLVFDQGLSLFVGLNVIPKATFLAQYAGRLGRSSCVRLLRGWLDHLKAHLALEGASFDLDFHTVPILRRRRLHRAPLPAQAQPSRQGRAHVHRPGRRH
jgi:hypothetical protein